MVFIYAGGMCRLRGVRFNAQRNFLAGSGMSTTTASFPLSQE
jgi:hypothetical protein